MLLSIHEWLIVCIVALLAFGCFYYRGKYRAAVVHHRDAAVLWQRMMLNIMGEQIAAHFRNSMVNNYVVRLNKSEIEISIGDEDLMIPVDMLFFKTDPNAA